MSPAAWFCLALALAAGGETAQVVVGEGDAPVVVRSERPELSGWAEAPAGAVVTVRIGESAAKTTVNADGTWRLSWPEALEGGSYVVTVVIEGGAAPWVGRLVVQPLERLPLAPLVPPSLDYAPPDTPGGDDLQEYTDRWRIVPPPMPFTAGSSRWDPYNQNILKGDRPIRGDDLFLVLTGVSDSLAEVDGIPVPSGVSADRPGSIRFFGRSFLALGSQSAVISAELFRGDTAFRPFDWRVKVTLAANLNYVRVEENAVVKPDVRRGTTRTDGRLALQELFYERKLRDLSPNFDFASVRVGIQPFNSDFRGFIFTDTTLGVRLFANADSNRWQANLAFFERLEKDTNSGLNTFERRRQQVVVANLYRQDFVALGYTAQVSLHLLRDQPSFHFDRNGFLARPDPVGSFTPHEIEAAYVGFAGFGHVGRWNLDHAVYGVFGRDTLNPVAGPERIDRPGEGDAVGIRAGMAAIEVSYDKDWLRPRLAVFYATGDDDPVDRDAHGFDAIFDNPAFAGGGFSYWNRLGLRLAGTGVTLVNRGSLLPSLKSSKEEGQPNFVNPGLLLLSAGLDIEVTPKLKVVTTVNHLRFDATEPLELLLFERDIGHEIGWDLSAGARYRPFLNQNVVAVAGVSALLPGDGFTDLFERRGALFAAFANLTLTF